MINKEMLREAGITDPSEQEILLKRYPSKESLEEFLAFLGRQQETTSFEVV